MTAERVSMNLHSRLFVSFSGEGVLHFQHKKLRSMLFVRHEGMFVVFSLFCFVNGKPISLPAPPESIFLSSCAAWHHQVLGKVHKCFLSKANVCSWKDHRPSSSSHIHNDVCTHKKNLQHGPDKKRDDNVSWCRRIIKHRTCCAVVSSGARKGKERKANNSWCGWWISQRL